VSCHQSFVGAIKAFEKRSVSIAVPPHQDSRPEYGGVNAGTSNVAFSCYFAGFVWVFQPLANAKILLIKNPALVPSNIKRGAIKETGHARLQSGPEEPGSSTRVNIPHLFSVSLAKGR